MMAPQEQDRARRSRPNGSGRASPPLLEVDEVTLQYKTRHHRVTATQSISFAIRKGDRFVILGPSGCGKSTILKAVGGFIRPVKGIIRLNGQPINSPGPDRVMVFQEFDQLLPWKTVRANVMFPLLMTGVGRHEADERARHYLDKVNLTAFAELHPHMLSGGMKQRVAIARALASEPAMLLMDEPFAALDALTRCKMQEELLALWDEARFTVLFVTHSIEEAILIGARILVLSPHPGRVKAEFDARALTHSEAGGADFASLNHRIHQTLFASRVENGARP